MKTVEERVQAGAAWLDEHAPDWLERVDLDALDLNNCGRCVLGQVFGDFYIACGDPLLGEDVSALGFDLNWPDNIPADSPEEWDFAALTAAWRVLIARRHGADSST